MKLFYAPEGRLRLTVDDRSYITVVPAWAAPLSYPNEFLGFMDGEGNEICMFKHPESELDPEMWRIAKQELDRRYLNGVIHRILSVKTEFGSTYWMVVTDKGEREFITQSLQENAQWLSATYLLVIDVDGNRFEIPDTTALDERSRQLLATTV